MCYWKLMELSSTKESFMGAGVDPAGSWISAARRKQEREKSRVEAGSIKSE